MQATRQDLRDWLIITIIILIGFLLLIWAGSMAIRFAPSWQLAATMQSNLDPNSDFLTNRPSGFIPAVDAAILTPPAWINFFQTPGATAPVRTPQPTSTSFSISPTVAASTNEPTTTVTPTSTVFYIPASPTKPGNSVSTPTPTTVVPPTVINPLNVDLQITKSDGTTTYTAGGTLTYSLVISNNGPNGVTGATVMDTLPAQISSANWSCSPGAGASCAASGTGNINDAVNIPSGQLVTYTVVAGVSTSANGALTNTATVSVPANYSDLNMANNSATDTNSPSVDLQITKYSGVTLYTPGGAPVVYTIVVTNSSTFQVNNATVTDTFSNQISSASWYCTPQAGATCTSSGTGNINDSVSLPAGRSVTYMVTANISTAATGDLTNTATVITPAEYTDLNLGNNTATHTDGYAATQPEVGVPDGDWMQIEPGDSVVVTVPTINTSGNSTPDMVYFERIAAGTLVDLDWVQLEVSADGVNWFTVFYWGDANEDTNTNVNHAICPLVGGVEEDNCHIQTSSLHQSTGVTIDIDARAPTGSYSWVRITSPVGGNGDSSDVDSIQPFYP